MIHSEGTIAVPGGRVWFRRAGNRQGLPILVIHGGPGFPHNYLRSLERLANEREVIFWDQLGCGKSESTSDRTLWTLPRFVTELGAVVDSLGLQRFHLFGHSWGGMLAQQYVLDSATQAVTLTLSNSLASVPRFAEDVARLKALLDKTAQAAIDVHEAAGTTDSSEYQAAVKLWFETHICRLLPWPEEIQLCFENVATEVYETMFGPSEFHITGNLRCWDVLDRLTEIALPTQLLAGRFDECTPAHMRDMHQRIENSRFVVFESSAHLPFVEEPMRFDRVMRDFLRLHE
ncbi:proline iminopeptidase-family hydrolase [Mycobacterium simiae]|uniref:Proline iminopeptidase n=1 Tax=Mycobacterium simiae TaxID=1784 RepID=A0A1X0Y8Y0_MYCSI|nr:proline iminopeptidase-family hydrolase [Mycobacterium simiae]ORJ61670.1 proline iminopeptidase [Mycobacterium simiae]